MAEQNHNQDDGRGAFDPFAKRPDPARDERGSYSSGGYRTGNSDQNGCQQGENRRGNPDDPNASWFGSGYRRDPGNGNTANDSGNPAGGTGANGTEDAGNPAGGTDGNNENNDCFYGPDYFSGNRADGGSFFSGNRNSDRYFGAAYTGSQPAPPPAPPVRKTDGKGLAAMILGILSIVCCCIPYLGLIASVLALVFGIMSYRQTRSGFALAGIITGAVGVVFSIIVIASVMANPDIWNQIKDLYPDPDTETPPDNTHTAALLLSRFFRI